MILCRLEVREKERDLHSRQLVRPFTPFAGTCTMLTPYLPEIAITRHFTTRLDMPGLEVDRSRFAATRGRL